MASNDLVALTKVVYGEARGEPDDGKAGVAWAVINRHKKSGKSIAYEASKPRQFDGYAAAGSMSDASAKAKCEDIAKKCINGSISDPTGGATFFCAKNLNPYWASGKQPCKVIGNHKFFKGIAPY